MLDDYNIQFIQYTISHLKNPALQHHKRNKKGV